MGASVRPMPSSRKRPVLSHRTWPAPILLAAWFAFMGLWPLQAAAYRMGAHMTAACRMMPRLISMTGHHGRIRGIGACQRLQCRHHVGPRLTAVAPIPAVAGRSLAVAQPVILLVIGRHLVVTHPSRGPPPYLRFGHFLI